MSRRLRVASILSLVLLTGVYGVGVGVAIPITMTHSTVLAGVCLLPLSVSRRLAPSRQAPRDRRG